MRFHGFSTPIFVVCRDKLTPLRELLEWLESRHYSRLILVDNNSTYPPLIDFLDRTSHTVVRHKDNLGPYQSVWGEHLIERFASNEHYVVTDCDVVPEVDCPADAVDYFHWVLQRYPDYAKVGFALRIDNLPDHYALAAEARAWERQWWWRRLEPNLYHAAIDTTFGLYRPSQGFVLRPAIRTGRPYWARHLPWYANSSTPTSEDVYYRDHARPGLAHWDLNGKHRSESQPRFSVRERLMWPFYSTFKVQRAVPETGGRRWKSPIPQS